MSRDQRTLLGIAGLACVACCAGAIGAVTIAGIAIVGIAGAALALLAIPAVIRHRRRRCASTVATDRPVHVAAPATGRPRRTGESPPAPVGPTHNH